MLDQNQKPGEVVVKMLNEIGGYIELDEYRLPMLHEGSIALNCGRNCLAYLLRTKNIKRIALPYFLCSSVKNLCKREGVDVSYYHTDEHFLPKNITLHENEWMYLVNYYGQLENETIQEYVLTYKNVIVDQAQAYFQEPLPGVDILYTCRKFFGVPDGGFLYSDVTWDVELPLDESFQRMTYLLGRYERSANEFYAEYSANNHLFAVEPVKQMSKLTKNLLHGVDYAYVKQRRSENFACLDQILARRNGLEIKPTVGAYMYPFYVENGSEIRKKLQAEKIYIPTLWPNVLEDCQRNDLEYRMAKNILPLPVDQRYGVDDMRYLAGRVMECIN